jgi:hypothetical protein
MKPMARTFFVLVLLLFPSGLEAGDKSAAKLRSPVGTVLQRSGDRWLAPVLYDAVPAGVALVALPGARGLLDVKEGDVRLVLAGNLPQMSKAMVLESAVSLRQPSDGRDLEFTLNRGRVLIENNKDDGPAKVRVHIQDKSLDFDLLDKKSVVALELSSRWPAGAPFLKKPTAGHKPVGELVFLVAKGRSAIELNLEKQTLQGPVMYEFDTLRGVKGPLKLNNAPDWVQPADKQPQAVKTIQSAVEKLRVGIADKGIAAALTQARQSQDPALRAVAAYSGVALDEPAAGIAALIDKAQEVRLAGINALNNYIGRGSAQDLRLYDILLAEKVKSGQAAIIMELLHGMSAEARLRPETYDTLIAYLDNDQIGIRELAAMNLRALVPQGSAIAYDAAASRDQRSRAQAAWRKLVPEGQVPKTP